MLGGWKLDPVQRSRGSCGWREHAARRTWCGRACADAVVVRRVAQCGSLLRSVCGCGPPDALIPQATGYYNRGMTALLFAAEAGSLELCQWLVTKNADVNAKA